MPHQFDHQTTSTHSADAVYAALTDPDCLRARLEQLGGPGAELLGHETDDAGARLRLRHGLDANELPPMVRGLLSGDVVIEREERWTRKESGNYQGEATVTITGAPAPAGVAGAMRLRDAAAGSELVFRGEASVQIPIIGAKIEGIVAEQLQSLLAAEMDFTQSWLDRQS